MPRPSYRPSVGALGVRVSARARDKNAAGEGKRKKAEKKHENPVSCRDRGLAVLGIHIHDLRRAGHKDGEQRRVGQRRGLTMKYVCVPFPLYAPTGRHKRPFLSPGTLPLLSPRRAVAVFDAGRTPAAGQRSGMLGTASARHQPEPWCPQASPGPGRRNRRWRLCSR